MVKKRHPLHGTYQHLLAPREDLRSVYALGMHTVLLTGKRVILKRNISHNLMAFSYQEIEAVMYLTTIRWVSLIISSLFFIISYVFFAKMPTSEVTTFQFSGMSVTAIEGGITSTPVFYHLIAFIAAVLGFIMLFHFILSLFGKVRIVLEGQRKPITIMAKYSDEIPRVLNAIEHA